MPDRAELIERLAEINPGDTINARIKSTYWGEFSVIGPAIGTDDGILVGGYNVRNSEGDPGPDLVGVEILESVALWATLPPRAWVGYDLTDDDGSVVPRVELAEVLVESYGSVVPDGFSRVRPVYVVDQADPDAPRAAAQSVVEHPACAICQHAWSSHGIYGGGPCAAMSCVCGTYIPGEAVRPPAPEEMAAMVADDQPATVGGSGTVHANVFQVVTSDHVPPDTFGIVIGQEIQRQIDADPPTPAKQSRPPAKTPKRGLCAVEHWERLREDLPGAQPYRFVCERGSGHRGGHGMLVAGVGPSSGFYEWQRGAEWSEQQARDFYAVVDAAIDGHDSPPPPGVSDDLPKEEDTAPALVDVTDYAPPGHESAAEARGDYDPPKPSTDPDPGDLCGYTWIDADETLTCHVPMPPDGSTRHKGTHRARNRLGRARWALDPKDAPHAAPGAVKLRR